MAVTSVAYCIDTANKSIKIAREPSLIPQPDKEEKKRKKEKNREKKRSEKGEKKNRSKSTQS